MQRIINKYKLAVPILSKNVRKAVLTDNRRLIGNKTSLNSILIGNFFSLINYLFIYILLLSL